MLSHTNFKSDFSSGINSLLWIDLKNLAKILVSTMGASGAGVAVLMFSDNENSGVLHLVLKYPGT